MAHFVWFMLLDLDGQPYKGASGDKVSVISSADVADFRAAVKARCSNTLSLVDPNQLKVYKDKSAFNNNEVPLPSSQLLNGLGKTENEFLVIIVHSSMSFPPTVSQEFSSPENKKRIQFLKQFIFYTCVCVGGQNMLGCVTAYNRYRLATFAHGIHQNMKVGDVLKIFSVMNDGEYEVKVMKVEKERDCILLESQDELCQVEVCRASAYEGEEYIQLGLSATTQEVSPFSVSRGIFTSTKYNSNGHFLSSAGANPGDSGGGCFAEKSNTLYGINVGCEGVSITNDTTLYQLGTRHPARAHIVPSAFFN